MAYHVGHSSSDMNLSSMVALVGYMSEALSYTYRILLVASVALEMDVIRSLFLPSTKLASSPPVFNDACRKTGESDI